MDNSLVWVALGGNLGERKRVLSLAISLISKEFDVKVRRSGFYESKPMYLVDQPMFLNAVICFNSARSAPEILAQLLCIETQIGRVRSIPNGARIIDLDLLAIGHQQIQTSFLTLPHPRISERLFVLVPWKELDPNWTLPFSNKTITDYVQILVQNGQSSPIRVSAR